MNTETHVITATPYVPPQMTIVPLRASGAMLLGSAPIERMQQYEFESSFGSKFQEAYDDAFSTETMGAASGWGDDFYTL